MWISVLAAQFQPSYTALREQHLEGFAEDSAGNVKPWNVNSFLMFQARCINWPLSAQCSPPCPFPLCTPLRDLELSPRPPRYLGGLSCTVSRTDKVPTLAVWRWRERPTSLDLVERCGQGWGGQETQNKKTIVFHHVLKGKKSLREYYCQSRREVLSGIAYR